MTTTSAAVRKLNGTTDAMVWAKEWCSIAADIVSVGGNLVDEGWMVGWFANAIETGRNFGQRQTEIITEDSEEHYTFMGWVDFWVSESSSASTRIEMYRCDICKNIIEVTQKVPHFELWHQGV